MDCILDSTCVKNLTVCCYTCTDMTCTSRNKCDINTCNLAQAETKKRKEEEGE